MLKGIDHLWYKRHEGINYLDDLFYHFDIINAPNIGKGYNDKFGNPEEFFGKSDFFFNKSDSSEKNLVDSSILDNLAADLKEASLGFNPILLDPAVSICNEERPSLSLESSSNVIGKVEELSDFNHDISSLCSKRHKPKYREQGNFKVTTSNKFGSLHGQIQTLIMIV